MVSVYPIPPPGQDFTHFYNNFYMGGGGGDSMEKGLMEMTNSSHDDKDLLQIAPFGNLGSGVEDQNKKIRKPYTITKSRESWTEEEHDKFLEALQLFDRDWKKIEAFVGSKTVIQIRSHAQKYFLKVQKNGNSEHVPPPRPKRKAAHPYPQKAPKNVLSQITGSLQSSATLLDPGHAMRSDTMSGSRNSVSNAPLSPWAYNVAPADHVSHISKDDIGLAGVTMTQNYSSSSNERTPRVWAFNESNLQVKENQCKAVKAMPDFAQVYSYIGSVFDPEASDHLQRLKEMDPVNIETVLMMMKNLSVNLTSPEFKDHRRLLSFYNAGIENHGIGSTISST